MKTTIIKIISLVLALIVMSCMLLGILYDRREQTIEVLDVYMYEYNVTNDTIQNVAEMENVGGGTLEVETVDTVVIGWINGMVDIKETDDTAISITESRFYGELPLCYGVSDNVLEIRYMQEYENYSSESKGKTLTVNLPAKNNGKSYDISIDAKKSDVRLRNLHIGTLSVDTEAGYVMLGGGNIGTAYLNVTEGDFYSNASVSDITALVGIGSAEVKCSRSANSVNIDSIGGLVTVRLPKDIPGFIANMDIGSESYVRTNFDWKIQNQKELPPNSKYTTYTYGDESVYIDIRYNGYGTISIVDTEYDEKAGPQDTIKLEKDSSDNTSSNESRVKSENTESKYEHFAITDSESENTNSKNTSKASSEGKSENNPNSKPK